MTQSEHLWAIGYDDMERAAQVRDEIIRLGWETPYLTLLDVAVVVRHPDGSFTCNREPFPAVTNILGCTAVGFLAGLVLLALERQMPQHYARERWGRHLEALVLIAMWAILIIWYVDLHAISAAASAGFLVVFAMVNIGNAEETQCITSTLALHHRAWPPF